MLKIRVKTKKARVLEQNSISLSKFFTLYFQHMLSELNVVLSDYHSIQEHASRNKIIEFANLKLKDLDLLQTFVKGVFLLEKLFYLNFKGDDCTAHGQKLVEMFGFLSILCENMKTSFIPRSEFNLALQTFLDYRKLLPTVIYNQSSDGKTDLFPDLASNFSLGETAISQKDLSEIHRMMRIYLLREDLSRFKIENGILIIESDFFSFELALCGHYQNPHWQLFKVNSYTKSKRAEDQLLKRLRNISQIVEFVKFFEIRKKAADLFDLLESKTGFYQNFKGIFRGIEVSGLIKNNDFYCNFFSNNEIKEFKNTGINVIRTHLEKNSSTAAIEDKNPLSHVQANNSFMTRILGSSTTYFSCGMLFSLNKASDVCFFGKIRTVHGLEIQKLVLGMSSTGVVGLYGEIADSQNLSVNQSDNDASRVVATRIKPEDFLEFVRANIHFLVILYGIRGLGISCKINRFLLSDHFYIDKNFSLSYTMNGDQISVDFPASQEGIKSLIERLHLIFIQKTGMAEMEILENKPGKKITFSFLGMISIEITHRISTNISALNEDLLCFDMKNALEYTKIFGIFYAYSLFPTVFTKNKLGFDLSDFIEEFVEVTFQENSYTIVGPKMLQIAKIPSQFGLRDTKTFLILQKFFLTNRFILLKRMMENHNGPSGTQSGTKPGPNEIYLKNNRKISLTHDGIKFTGDSPDVNRELTRALNCEKDVLRYLTNFFKKNC